MKKTDEQWRQTLDPERYAVLRQGATEPAFAGSGLWQVTQLAR